MAVLEMDIRVPISVDVNPKPPWLAGVDAHVGKSAKRTVNMDMSPFFLKKKKEKEKEKSGTFIALYMQCSQSIYSDDKYQGCCHDLSH
jgi:hypothetical protein